ncbi:hypothetical protein DY000_02023634 [Brassica cretica]|uniref:Uncharacterized protein n=1 Tax=Brassica cretica TaxID=69181 RepID=A0ABQ7E4E3_BRACR|nr:hypothetical protein DY000_02023634 [Brassica cretica]
MRVGYSPPSVAFFGIRTCNRLELVSGFRGRPTMVSKGMGRSTIVNSVFRFRSQAFVVNNTTPSERIDLPSKLARGVASRLIFGAGCSSDRCVSCGMTLTTLPVSTKIFERAMSPTSNAITKASSWGISSFTVSCSWKVKISPFYGVSSNAVIVGLLIVPREVWERLSRLSTSLDVIEVPDLRSSRSIDPMQSGQTWLESIVALRKLRSLRDLSSLLHDLRDLGDSFSSLNSCYELRPFKAHAFDRGPLCLDLQVWGILVLTCVTSERAAGSRKKDLVPGGVFSFIIIILRRGMEMFGVWYVYGKLGTGESWKAVVVAFKVMAMGRERIDMAPFGTY